MLEFVPRMLRLNSQDDSFSAALDRLLSWESEADNLLREQVADILHSVRAEGDSALLRYCRQFDGLDLIKSEELEIPAHRWQQAVTGLPQVQRTALEHAAQRIRHYAEYQRIQDWDFVEPDGTRLGQRVTPLDSVGLYVPGGKAAYPSSVLMNAIPAKVAGVPLLVMVVPAPHGQLNEMVLAAAAIAGVDRIFTVGGAQAIAALAYGTETIPAVDKIVGPGNSYVAAAKREVFGTVGIDMIAGPSEILVICDGGTNPDWIAADLFSQAEHDEQAQAILISPDGNFLDLVAESMDKLLSEMPRAEIIRKSLDARGALIQVSDLHEAVEVANYIAPEHLELSVEDPDALLAMGLRHAGALFMGRHTSEALGDYCAGPNHVLPTSRTARFSSPLGVYDFQKRSSIIHCSPKGANVLGQTACELAKGEGLYAHARSAELRIEP